MTVVVIRSTECTDDSRVDRLIESLAEMNCNPTLINWKRSESIHSVTHDRCVTHTSRTPFGRGIYNFGAQVRWQIFVWRTLRQIRPTFVYACDLDGALMVSLFSIKAPIPWVFDQFDSYGDRIGGKWTKWVVRRIESRVAKLANARIVASETRRQGTFEDAFVVANSPSEQIEPIPWELNRVLFYGGVLHEDRGLRTAVDAIRLKTDWKLRVAGFGPLGEWLKQESESLDNLEFLGRVTHGKIMEEASRSTAVLATYDPSIPNNVATASNKLGEAALVGRPVIAARGTEIASVSLESGFGFCVDYADVDQLMDVMEYIETNFQTLVSVPDFCNQYRLNNGWRQQQISLFAALTKGGIGCENREELS